MVWCGIKNLAYCLVNFNEEGFGSEGWNVMILQKIYWIKILNVQL